MLTWIRDQSTSLFMIIVMGLLILTFAFWGVGDYFTQSSNDAVATVNGEKISFADYSNKFSQRRQNLINQFGDGIDPSYFESPAMKRSFLDSLINAKLLMQITDENGYYVTPMEIKAIINEAPSFQGEDGQFDKALYAAFLSQTNQSVAKLEADLRESIVSGFMSQLMDESSFTTSHEKNSVALLNKQARTFEYLNISASKFLETIEPDEEAINQYYNENSTAYMTQEKVAIDYIELDAAEVAKTIEIGDVEALEYFETNKARYITEEQRLASHILLSDDANEGDPLAQMKEIKARIDAGESFADLAKEFSSDPGSASNGGDLGYVVKGVMVPEFETALFALQANSISEPVKSQFGYHLIQLNEIKASTQAIFEEVKTDVIEELQASQSETKYLELASRLSELVLDAQDNLDQVADSGEYEIKTTELFGRTGGTTGISANQTFVQAAFSDLVKDQLLNSELVNISDTHVVFMHLNSIEAAVVKPLEEVRDQVVNAIKSDQANEKVAELASNIANSVNNEGKTLAEMGESHELELITADNIERIGSAQPFNLVKNVFSMPTPSEDVKPTEVLESNGNDKAVVTLLSVTNPSIESITDIEAQSAQLARTLKTNEQQLLINSLRESASIFINEDLLNQTAQQ